MDSIFQVNNNILQFEGLDIYLDYKGQYVSSSQLKVDEINENVWCLIADFEPGEISLYFPTGNSDVLVGRELGYIDKNYDRLYCSDDHDLRIRHKHDIDYEPYTVIDVSGFHIIDPVSTENRTFTVAHHHPCSIRSMHHTYSHYMKITADTLCGTTNFYIYRSCNYLVNLEVFHTLPAREMDFIEPFTLQQANEALYYLCLTRVNSAIPDNCLQIARGLQTTLAEEKIRSVIIGSLAKRLNGISCAVHDIDIMVEPGNHDHAADVLSRCSDKISSNDLNHRFMYNGIEVDLSYDNFNIHDNFNSTFNYATTKHGLDFISIEGLMWLYLINYYYNSSMHMDICKYHTSIVQVHHKVSSDGTTKRLPVTSITEEEKHRCYDLVNRYKDATQTYKDIRINRPFQVNCFMKDDDEIFTVVNNGSKCDARLIVDSCPKSAIWMDITGRQDSLEIEDHEKFSCIFIPSVNYPGYVVCTI